MLEGLPPLPIWQLAGHADSFWRRLIWWSVGDLFPGSRSEGGVRGPETYPWPLCSTCGVQVSLPIPIHSLQCYALPKLTVCAVSLSMCITCSASPKLMVLILCSLSGCAPGCAPFSSFSLLRSPQPQFLANFNTWRTSIFTALVWYVWSSCFAPHSYSLPPMLCSAEACSLYCELEHVHNV